MLLTLYNKKEKCGAISIKFLNDFKKLLLDYYVVITFEIPLKEKMNHSLKYFIKKIKTLITFFLLPQHKMKTHFDS